MHPYKVLLFDLDDTLLRSDKTISPRTLDVLRQCRETGLRIGICTSRGEKNIVPFLQELQPDIVIASAGAIIQYQGETIYAAEFSEEETSRMIATAREICGPDVEITIDTLHKHYWNYSVDPNEEDASWGDVIYTRYENFHEKALKMCVEILDEANTPRLAQALPNCDCLKFTNGCWHKFTAKGATKEQAIHRFCAHCQISLDQVVGFGDDVVDIGMLKLCGLGVAMGNSVEAVKEAADIVIGTNDEDGIADFLTRRFLQ